MDPLTQTSELNSEHPQEEDEKEESGPLEIRVDSKNWKTRSKAYSELVALLQDPKTNTYSDYLPSISKFISDPNPGSQSKALEIVLLYIKNQPDLIITQSEILIKFLIEKCMTSPKTSIKNDSENIILDFFSIHKDNFETIIQTLQHCINNKNIKIQAAGINTINSIIQTFGIEKLSFKPFIGHIEKAASASNPIVRGEAINFYIESYRWVRELIIPYVEKLKKSQQEELHKAFEAITEYPRPTRWLKCEESQARDQQNTQKPRVLDIYDMADAKDIFTKYGENWVNSVLSMEKWTDKKQALQELNNEANYPKLAEKSPIELVTLSKRLLNDTNVQVMLQSMKLVGLLSKGQRKYFEPFAKQFLPLLLQKFKDKKTQVLQETHCALDNLMYSISVENAYEDIKSALEDSNPAVKTNTCAWLERIFECHTLDSIKAIIKSLAGICKKNTDDPSTEVRNSTYKLLACMLKKSSENVGQLIKDLPAVKLKKIEECSGVQLDVEKTQKKDQEIDKTSEPQKKNHKENPNSPSNKSHNKATPTQNDEDHSQSITPEEAEIIVKTFLPSSLIQQLKDNAWKEKQTGLLSLQEWIQNNTLTLQNHNEAILRFVRTTVKEWKENNFNVVKAAFEIFKYTSENASITKRTAYGVLNSGSLDKLSDPKLIETYTSCIYSITEVVGPKFVVSMLIKNTEESNKPKVVSECYGCIGKIISDYGIHTVIIKDVIDYAKNGLNGANPQIKKSSQSLIVLVYSFIGEKLMGLLSDVKESTMKVLMEDFARTQVVTKTSFKDLKGQESANFDMKKILEDTMPKVNIEKLITPAMLKKISDANWKVRKEGLEEFDNVLNSNKGKILPVGLKSIVKALISRFSDPNKALVRQALILSCKLACLLGSDSKDYAKNVLPAIINCLADKQNLLRLDALAAINKWSEEAGIEQVILYSSEPLGIDNPELRSELLKWLLEHKESFKNIDMKNYVQPVLACLQDRSASIRNLAEIFFSEVVEVVSFEAFLPYLKDIKPAVMNTLSLIFEKYRRRFTIDSQSLDNVILPLKNVRSTTKEGTRIISKETNRKKSVCATKKISLNDTGSPLNKTQLPLAYSVEISIISVGNKEKRLESENKIKWGADNTIPDLQERIKDQMRICFSTDLCMLLLNQDFKRQIDGVGYLSAFITSNCIEVIGVLDIIFRWVWAKLQEMGNTQLLKSIFEMLQSLVNMLSEHKYILMDSEAGMFLPILCEKVGISNFKTVIRGIIHSSVKIYLPDKVFVFVVAGCNSKNIKTKVECLEEIGLLIQDFGGKIFQPKDVKSIAKHASCSDSNVRKAAIKVIGDIFKIAGDKTWGMIGEIPDKIKELFEQKYKASSGVGLLRKMTLRESLPRIVSPKNLKVRGGIEDARSLTPHKSRDGAQGESTERVLNQCSSKNNKKTTLDISLRKPDKDKCLKKEEIQGKSDISYKIDEPQKSEIKIETFSPPSEDKTENFLIFNSPINKETKSFMLDSQSEDLPVYLLEDTKSPVFSEDDENLLFDLPNYESPKNTLDIIIETIKNAETSSKLEALVAINDIIQTSSDIYKEDLQKTANSLCDAIIKTIITTFDRPLQDLSLRFTKFFLNIVHKICSTKIIMRELTESSLFSLVEQILYRLLTEGLSKVGEKKEGEAILKTLNGIMLRILGHSRPTTIMVVLIKLLTKSKKESLVKMQGLILRCLLKLAKGLNVVIRQIDVFKIFTSIDEHLLLYKEIGRDDGCVVALKFIVNEIAKLLGNGIWQIFDMIRYQLMCAVQLESWIIIMLNSPSYSSRKFIESKTDIELVELFISLNEDYDSGIKKLLQYNDKNPQFVLAKYLDNLPIKIRDKTAIDFKDILKKDMANSKNFRKDKDLQNAEEIKKIEGLVNNKNNHNVDSSNTENKLKEFQRRLVVMKQRYGISNISTSTEFKTAISELKDKANNILNNPKQVKMEIYK